MPMWETKSALSKETIPRLKQIKTQNENKKNKGLETSNAFYKTGVGTGAHEG